MHENEIGTCVIEKAIEVHRVLGPGLLESVYEKVLGKELENCGFKIEYQLPIKNKFKLTYHLQV